MQLSESQFQATRHALTDSGSDTLIELMLRLQRKQDVSSMPRSVVGRAVTLGWLDDQGDTLTELGGFVSDPLREYTFWLERGRMLPSQDKSPHFAASYYTRKSVLEVGCGSGWNLISMREAGANACGVEPVTLYRQMHDILCERSGVSPAEIHAGRGEALPFEDKRFDIVVAISAHQYTNVPRLFAEMARVTKVGGEVHVIGGTLGTYLREGAKSLRGGGVSRMVEYVTTVANTLSFMVAKRRVLVRASSWSTANPVYPFAWVTQRWLRQAGLEKKRELVRLYPETCFAFERRA